MDSELQLFKQIKNYLESLGYPAESIFFEHLIENRNRIDVVVKKEDGIYIAVEVKNPKVLKLSSIQDIEYHPLTRKIQKEAYEVGAKYFILSDGKEHLWMKTGIGGRPEKIEEVRFSDFNIIKNTEKQFLEIILQHVFEYLRNFPITGNYLYDCSLILYLKLRKEINSDFNTTDFIYNDLRFDRPTSYHARNFSFEQVFQESLERLDTVNLLEAKLTVVEFIDNIFKKNSKDIVIPRWLSDLMVKIIDLDINEPIIDLYARSGSASSSVFYNNYINLISYSNSKENFYWIKVQQLLFLNEEYDTYIEPILQRGNFSISAKPSAILIAPPFNLKIEGFDDYNYSNGIKDSTSLFIDKALRAVNSNGKVIAIVPDNFLSSNQYLRARKHFLNIANIESVISLPQNSFKPFALVKTSLITFVKNYNNLGTYFASIEDAPSEYMLDCTRSEEIKKVLSDYNNFKLNRQFTASKHGFVEENLDPGNLHFSKYLLSHNLFEGNYSTNYILIPLKELLKDFFKGSLLVSNENGDIPYIAPGAIRRFRINKEAFSYTSLKQLPNKSLQTEIGDILLNAIGPNRGKAAIVTSDLANMYINRHVICLRANGNLIYPEYLAIALNTAIVQEQFLDRSTGAVIPSLNLKNIEEVLVPVPDKDIQLATIDEFRSLSDENDLALIKIANIESQIKDKLSKIGKEDTSK